ncbi:divergent polysaccharide deacteylase family protein [uncultured Tateyamaria sp.]|uniref:divergent polysaccharide deacteylase family protein n=1 Tax=uncultured Tateyamaria sp. TaxID=455651 RepID=UPI0026198B8B|nr:divergent polysaccharide deacteylase family protein [uncultured Tateyamaria sp.]
MARGFLSGVLVGGVVSVVGAGVASVVADGPFRPEAEVTAPAGTTAPAAGDTTTASAVTDADLVRDGDAPQVASPGIDDVSAAENAGADTPTVPETGGADALSDPAAAADAGGVALDTDAPVQPGAPSDAPAVPGSETELSISTEPAQPAAPTVPDTSGAFAPSAGDAPEVPGSEAPAPDTGQASTAPEEPDVAVAPAQPDTPAPQPDVVAALPEPRAEGRPTIGTPAGSLVDRTPTVPGTEAPETPDVAPDAPPIVAFATPFENPDDKPLMSIVLIDSGVDLSGGPVGPTALQSFPYPLTFAVDVTLPDSAARMAEYRAQGFEVMALVDLPQGATASDTEVAMQAALAAAPEAVAVMEGPGSGVQGTREASDQVTEAVLASGHGLVLQSKGLNTAQKLAARAGVPAGLVFRDFDSADQTPTVIRRFLDQAAFRAGQEGGVIMVGRVRPDTISALLLWGLQDRAERVALAPVSAVLTTLNGDP